MTVRRATTRGGQSCLSTFLDRRNGRWLAAACLLLLGACRAPNEVHDEEIGGIQRLLRDSHASEEDRVGAYVRLRRLPRREDMRRWVQMVNDPSLDAMGRCLAFHAFWARAATPGASLQQLVREYHIQAWFTPATVVNANELDALPGPVEDRFRVRGVWVGLFDLFWSREAPEPYNEPVLIVVPDVSLDEFLQSAHESRSTRDLRIEYVHVWNVE